MKKQVENNEQEQTKAKKWLIVAGIAVAVILVAGIIIALTDATFFSKLFGE